MTTRKTLLGASFAAMLMCALWLAPASGAKAKFRATYSGSFTMVSRAQSPTMLDYTTLDVAGIKLKHYKTKTVDHVKTALYKFTAGQVKWHAEYNVDGCAYTLDREAPLTSFPPMQPGQVPLFLIAQPKLKPGTYRMGGNFQAKITEPVDTTCTASDGTTSHLQMVPVMPPVSPWAGLKTKLPRLKNHFSVDAVQGDETDHASFSWDLVGS